MNTRRDPDRLIHAFLMEGQTELADQVYDSVRSTVEHRRQRVFIGPWRMPIMNKLVPLGLGAAAVVGVLLLGSRLVGAPSGPGGPIVAPSPSPTPSIAAPSPSDSGTALPLTETFTSDTHGFSISYPTGWVARPATEPWTENIPDFISTAGDVFYDPVREGNLWIAVASQPFGASTPEEWVAETLALPDACFYSEPVTVDGADGRIGTEDCTRAAVAIDGRGYSFWLYTGDDEPSLSEIYDGEYFRQVFATVQLQPEDAVDVAPTASP